MSSPDMVASRKEILSDSEEQPILSAFPEFVFPNYQKYSISNIGNSILSAFGIRTNAPSPVDLHPSEKIVLITLDGLGANLLRRALPKISAKSIDVTSVFPSTTSSAYTSIARGVPPSVHGITGYWQRDSYGKFGQLVRYRSHPDSPEMRLPKDPSSLILRAKGKKFLPDALLSEGVACTTILNGKYLDKEFSSIIGNQGKGIDVRPFSGNARDFGPEIKKALESSRDRAFISAYYDGIDKASHSSGPNSEQTLSKIVSVFRSLKNSLSKTRGDFSLLLTADHGQVPVSREKGRLWYREDKLLSSLLSGPPAGDNRAVYFYPKRGMEDSLEKHLETSPLFRDNFAVFPSKKLLKAGLFGPLKGIPKANIRILEGRIGKFTAISRNSSQVSHSEKGRLLGNHGSLTEEEIFVPLIFVKHAFQ